METNSRIRAGFEYLLYNIHVTQLHCNQYCISILVKVPIQRQRCFQQCHVLWLRNISHTAEHRTQNYKQQLSFTTIAQAVHEIS